MTFFLPHQPSSAAAKKYLNYSKLTIVKAGDFAKTKATKAGDFPKNPVAKPAK